MKGGAHVKVLVDTTGRPVQSKEVAAGLQRFLGETIGDVARTAIIAPVGLASLQAHRIQSGDRVRYFTNEEDARQWLAEA